MISLIKNRVSMGKVRIAGGKHANRNIAFKEDTVRPTGSRVRTILFDWLRPHIKNTDCLDLFSGSGILAFQAMSEGARSVLCIDQNPEVCTMIKKEATRIGEDNITVSHQAFPCPLPGNYAICFMDPPFEEHSLYQTCFDTLYQTPTLKPGALLYVEANIPLESPFKSLKQKKVGKVWMHLFQKEA